MILFADADSDAIDTIAALRVPIRYVPRPAHIGAWRGAPDAPGTSSSQTYVDGANRTRALTADRLEQGRAARAIAVAALEARRAAMTPADRKAHSRALIERVKQMKQGPHFGAPGGHLFGECTNCAMTSMLDGLGVDITPTAVCAGQCFGRDDYTACVTKCVTDAQTPAATTASSATPWLIGGALALVLCGVVIMWDHK